MDLKYVKCLPANTRGRDFAVGDLHGHVSLLLDILNGHNFDARVDRVFSVGDLIDRGPDSLGSLQLLNEIWFHCVRGNHEQMMVNYFLHPEHDKGYWFQNGGEWAQHHDHAPLKSFATRLEELPYIITVGEDQECFNLVHAEYPRPHKYPLQDIDDDDSSFMLWSRSLHRAYERYRYGLQPEEPIDQALPLTFCGHTSVSEPGLFRSHYWLDTGCGWWPNGELTVVEVGEVLKEYAQCRD